MGWRVVAVTKPSKLDYSLGYMTVRDVDNTVKVHLSEISVLIIENTACSVTCALLSALIAQKIKVIFCDEKRNPCSELTSLYGSHDCSIKLKNQIHWNDVSKQEAWTIIVAQKIKNQAQLLEHYGFEQNKMLFSYLEELEFNDATNREGHAAKVYFNALFGKSFTRSDDISTNAALNYGYSIILSCFNREVVSCGYLTQIGLFHDNMFNQFNLSCDLMEPFRPIVDNCVLNMKLNEFTTEHKHELVNLLNKEFIIDSKNNTLLNAIKIYTKSVFSSIENCDVSLIKFPVINYEL
ncbi:MAG: type II CRISPR-associated endonuclease Cas1 [Clostridia bacterium]|nr:type II CRISPR-associated endonuclease Cas1 [Clostridia bacterium]